MNFGHAFLLLFALGKAAGVREEHQLPKLRGLITSVKSKNWYVNSYQEQLGQCKGAMCGMWGDPHIISCDGVGFDCNAVGLFTLMSNFLYNIQAHFIHVGTTEMNRLLDNNRHPVASYATDVAIDFVENTDLPTMQFSIPEFVNDDDLPPSERGCLVDLVYDKDIDGHGRTEEGTIVDCRERCESIDGCTKFTYVADGGCHVADDSAKATYKPEGWSRTVSGFVDRCGHPAKYEAREGTEIDKAKTIGNGTGNKKKKNRRGEGCPMLFYLDGELQDISNLEDDGYLYGGPGDASYAQLYKWNKIKIVHTTAAGSLSEILIETDGSGPGELWGCHWNVWVCLPETEQSAFEEGSLGLFGKPDGNPQNDWMSPAGDLIELPTAEKQKRGNIAYNYCLDNWCVSQDDSFMVPPAGASYDDIKCMEEEYIDFEVDNPDCLISADKIIEKCKDHPPLLVQACQIDCCLGGCGQIDEVLEEVEDLTKLSDEEDQIIYDVKTPAPETNLCDDDYHEATGETACPSSDGSVVKVIHQTAEIPEDEPIIYGIVFSDPKDDDHGREVKFRVDNPFENNADIYVRYEKKVGQYANDPACEPLEDTVAGCDLEAPEITVGCIEYPGVQPFALVDVYFASDDPFVMSNADSETEVEKCCKPPEYSGVGVIKYSFKIQCVCPDGEADE